MIDLHCHLLPGIDDGPATLSQSLQLARLATANGITHAIVTPHMHEGRWENTASIIKTLALDFKQALLDANIPLQIGTAAEVRIGAEIKHQIHQRQIPFLGHWEEKKVMLLEMPHSHVPDNIEHMIAWLLERNILPLVAHPERNKGIHRRLSKIDPLIEMGCLFQVTAGSIAGRFGPSAQHRAIELLEKGVVTVLASDAHSLRHRPPDLIEGKNMAATIIGENAADHLVLTNPWKIVGEQFVAA